MNGVFAVMSFAAALLVAGNIAAYYYNVVDFRPALYLTAAFLAAVLTFALATVCRRTKRIVDFLKKYPDRILLAMVLLLFEALFWFFTDV